MRNLGDWQGWLRVPSIWKSIRQAPSHPSALSSLNKSCCTRRGTSLRAGPRDDWQKYKGRMKEMKYQDTMTPTLRLDTLTPTLRLASLVLAAIGFMFILSVTAQAATFHVTTTADNGDNNNPTAGSLRKAILDANGNPGPDVIDFQIPGGGFQTISPPSPLPTITDSVTIDGYTQPGASKNTLANGNNAVLLIELDGTNAGSSFSGIGLDLVKGSTTL